ncbi:MAG: hypothetical protein ABIO63_02745 [Casimicrobiaceae bacterium]
MSVTFPGILALPGADKLKGSFEVKRDARRITIQRQLRDATSGPGYLGPRGPFVDRRDLARRQPLGPSRVGHRGTRKPAAHRQQPLLTGDATFDKRLTASLGGEPVRDGRLDAVARVAVTNFPHHVCLRQK